MAFSGKGPPPLYCRQLVSWVQFSKKVAAIPEQTRFFAIADQPPVGRVDQGGGLACPPGLPVGQLLDGPLRSSSYTSGNSLPVAAGSPNWPFPESAPLHSS
jgi:hypothetical protein